MSWRPAAGSPGRGRDFLVASVDASQLGQLVLEPLPLPFGFGLVEAHHSEIDLLQLHTVCVKRPCRIWGSSAP